MNCAKAKSQHLHVLLMERFPAAFPKGYDAIKPLKIGIADDFLLRLGDTMDRRLLNQVLANKTSRDGCLLAVLRGEDRIDLDGYPAGTVSEAAKARATQCLAESVQRQQTRAAARKAQAEKERRRAEVRRRIEEKRRLKAERRRLHEEAAYRKTEHLAVAEAARQSVQPSARALHRHRSAVARSAQPAPTALTTPAMVPSTPVPSTPPVSTTPVTVKIGAGTATVTVRMKKWRTLSLKPEADPSCGGRRFQPLSGTIDEEGN